jgi:hypothetical protein
MKKRNCNGQEAVEFILIAALVFFAALFAMFVFGNKLASFFQNDSAVAKTAGLNASVVDSSTPSQYDAEYITSAPAASTPLYAPPTINIGGYDVLENADGSLSFDAAGQVITIPQEIVALQETVMETTGSSSWLDLVKEVGYMVEKHKAEYPDSDVPVEILFGTGDRSASISGQTAQYFGSATANTTTIKVGNDLVIIQNDQDCSVTNTFCLFEGKFRIEGSLDASNNFTGNVTSKLKDYSYVNTSGTLKGKVDLSNGGFNINNGIYNQYDSYNNANITFDWILELGKAAQTTLN